MGVATNKEFGKNILKDTDQHFEYLTFLKNDIT
jgi:hypothetical protein